MRQRLTPSPVRPLQRWKDWPRNLGGKHGGSPWAEELQAASADAESSTVKPIVKNGRPIDTFCQLRAKVVPVQRRPTVLDFSMAPQLTLVYAFGAYPSMVLTNRGRSRGAKGESQRPVKDPAAYIFVDRAGHYGPSRNRLASSTIPFRMRRRSGSGFHSSHWLTQLISGRSESGWSSSFHPRYQIKRPANSGSAVPSVIAWHSQRTSCQRPAGVSMGEGGAMSNSAMTA